MVGILDCVAETGEAITDNDFKLLIDAINRDKISSSGSRFWLSIMANPVWWL